MHNDLWKHARQEESKKTQCKSEAGPVVPVLHYFQRVTFEVDISVEVHLMKRLHWDLVLAAVLHPVFLFVELEVVFYAPTRIASLFILPRRYARGDGPEDHENGDARKEGEEDPCEETSAGLAGKVAWNDGQQGEEQDVVEALAPGCIRRERTILDRWVLLEHCQLLLRSIGIDCHEMETV